MLPQVLVSQWYPGNHPQNIGVTETTNHLINQTDKTIEQLEQRVRRYYDGITLERWKAIYTANERPLRIMACASRFTTFTQYCLRDLLTGFEKLGYETQLHIEQSDILRSTKYDILATVDDFKPDLIIYIDHFRNEFPYLPKTIPFANWIQDLLPNIANPAFPALEGLDFTYVFSKHWQKYLEKFPQYINYPIYFLPVGINTNIYIPKENCEKSIDILYVSHLVEPEHTLQPLRDSAYDFIPNEQELALLDGNILTLEQLMLCYMLITKVFDNTLIDDIENYSPDMPATRIAFAKRILERANLSQTDELTRYFANARRVNLDLHRIFKSRPIQFLIANGQDVHVYGNNWEKYAEFKLVARGPAKNGRDLNELTNKARICLNNSPGTSLHMRTMEIMGSGAFMLSRNIGPDLSSITNYFPKDELALFSNEIDIVDKIRFYLANDEIRSSIARKNHARATELFSYPAIAANIQQSIVERLSA
jgi:glycosyltransferase involved in cell wall biosynthesis